MDIADLSINTEYDDFRRSLENDVWPEVSLSVTHFPVNYYFNDLYCLLNLF